MTERIPPRLLFVVNVDWFFLSHRLPLAIAARDAGIEVTIAAADTGKGAIIQSEGFQFIPLPISRKGTGIGGEIQSLLALWRLYRNLRPDLVHHVSIKPVLYGSIIARLIGGFPVVNAISGLGYTFSTVERAGIFQRMVKLLYRIALGHSLSHTIFQNPDDRELFLSLGLIECDRTILIRGSGVDCERFMPVPEPDGGPIVVLPSRLLWDKGVREFVEAARIVRKGNPKARFVLVGSPDAGNPTAVPEDQVIDWVNEGVVEWWGHREDMPVVLSSATVVTLPSYREGLPKVLLEAAACGRPIVATDVPGCREIVRPGENGILVPVKDPVALASAIQRLLDSKELRLTLGQAGRDIVLREFAEQVVVDQTLALYAKLLGKGWPTGDALS